MSLSSQTYTPLYASSQHFTSASFQKSSIPSTINPPLPSHSSQQQSSTAPASSSLSTMFPSTPLIHTHNHHHHHHHQQQQQGQHVLQTATSILKQHPHSHQPTPAFSLTTKPSHIQTHNSTDPQQPTLINSEQHIKTTRSASKTQSTGPSQIMQARSNSNKRKNQDTDFHFKTTTTFLSPPQQPVSQSQPQLVHSIQPAAATSRLSGAIRQQIRIVNLTESPTLKFRVDFQPITAAITDLQSTLSYELDTSQIQSAISAITSLEDRLAYLKQQLSNAINTNNSNCSSNNNNNNNTHPTTTGVPTNTIASVPQQAPLRQHSLGNTTNTTTAGATTEYQNHYTDPVSSSLVSSAKKDTPIVKLALSNHNNNNNTNQNNHDSNIFHPSDKKPASSTLIQQRARSQQPASSNLTIATATASLATTTATATNSTTIENRNPNESPKKPRTQQAIQYQPQASFLSQIQSAAISSPPKKTPDLLEKRKHSHQPDYLSSITFKTKPKKPSLSTRADSSISIVKSSMEDRTINATKSGSHTTINLIPQDYFNSAKEVHNILESVKRKRDSIGEADSTTHKPAAFSSSSFSQHINSTAAPASTAGPTNPTSTIFLSNNSDTYQPRQTAPSIIQDQLHYHQMQPQKTDIPVVPFSCVFSSQSAAGIASNGFEIDTTPTPQLFSSSEIRRPFASEASSPTGLSGLNSMKQTLNNQFQEIKHSNSSTINNNHHHIHDGGFISPFSAGARDTSSSSSADKLLKKSSLQQQLNSNNFVRISRVQPSPFSHSLSHFEVGKKLGNGKFADVFAATDKQTGFRVALKRIKKSTIQEFNLSSDIINEIRIQSQLQHQNIVRLYGFFIDADSVYLIQELACGNELFKHLKAQPYKKFTEQQAAAFIRQMIETLIYMHSKKVIHRDIKPENIIVVFNGLLKLCDFGYATTLQKQQLRKTFCGTLDYVSPEMAQGKPYDFAIDVWSIGVLTYELLIGQSPFFGDNQDATFKEIVNGALHFPSPVSLEAADFIQKILQRDPMKRLALTECLQHPFIYNEYVNKLTNDNSSTIELADLTKIS